MIVGLLINGVAYAAIFMVVAIIISRSTNDIVWRCFLVLFLFVAAGVHRRRRRHRVQRADICPARMPRDMARPHKRSLFVYPPPPKSAPFELVFCLIPESW